MRIHKLELENIGPFKNAQIEFIGKEDSIETPPVTIITGENGTGKTIILDAIRAILIGEMGNSIERDIKRGRRETFLIRLEANINEKSYLVESSDKFKPVTNSKLFKTNDLSFNQLINNPQHFKNKWIMDYWTSKLSVDSFEIQTIKAPKNNNVPPLSGIHSNIEVTELICFFDYLKSSDNESERKIGTELYNIVKEIIELSINNGQLIHVLRTRLQPIISINGNETSLDKLSSGNLYLIQRFVYVLKLMYSVCTQNHLPIENIKNTPGLLLIDEAENHLHPKWQKVFLNNILKIFPNLQIILTTHSPFIVSSIENSRIYVCESQNEYSIITEQTDYYSNKPIEEILLSPLFNTNPFNNMISELLIERKKLIQDKGDINKIQKIQDDLIKINPQYFSYFQIDELLNKIAKNESPQ